MMEMIDMIGIMLKSPAHSALFRCIPLMIKARLNATGVWSRYQVGVVLIIVLTATDLLAGNLPAKK